MKFIFYMSCYEKLVILQWLKEIRAQLWVVNLSFAAKGYLRVQLEERIIY